MVAELVAAGVKEKNPSVPADTATKIIYEQFCREMPRSYERYKWFPSIANARAEG